jgi:hypothetical protein
VLRLSAHMSLPLQSPPLPWLTLSRAPRTASAPSERGRSPPP